jgi:hypothetical protein
LSSPVCLRSGGDAVVSAVGAAVVPAAELQQHSEQQHLLRSGSGTQSLLH